MHAARSSSEMTEETFGQRLRSERERRRITLESIAARTKITVTLLTDLERDDMSRWPVGIFRRAFIRSYAAAVGLDPDDTTREFLELYPDPPQAAVLSGTRPSAPLRPAARLRLTLAATPPRTYAGGQILRSIQSRLAAAAWDAGSMLALALIAFLALDRFWAPLGVMILCYQVGSILILGNTPGVYLFAPKANDDHDSGSTSAETEGTAEASSSMFSPRASA